MIRVINDKCDFCGTCVAVCPVDSIELFEARIEILEHCTDCMLCVWICPVETLALHTRSEEQTCVTITTA